MTDPIITDQAEASKPKTLTLQADSDCLTLQAVVQLFTAHLGCLKSVEREITGKRRAEVRWLVRELAWDGAQLTLTVEGDR